MLLHLKNYVERKHCIRFCFFQEIHSYCQCFFLVLIGIHEFQIALKKCWHFHLGLITFHTAAHSYDAIFWYHSSTPPETSTSQCLNWGKNSYCLISFCWIEAHQRFRIRSQGVDKASQYLWNSTKISKIQRRQCCLHKKAVGGTMDLKEQPLLDTGTPVDTSVITEQ